MYSVLLVEDDKIMRSRLASIIESTDGLILLAAVSTLQAARRELAKRLPAVLITDLDLPDGNGIELIKEVRSDASDVDIMVVSVFGDERSVVTALMAGATGYLLKDGAESQVGASIFELIQGGSPISPSIARHVLRRMLGTSPSNDCATCNGSATSEVDGLADGDKTPLTKREADILAAVAKGFTYHEIAKLHEVSYHTVSSHIKNIYRKLEVHSRSEAIYEALSMGLVAPGF